MSCVRKYKKQFLDTRLDALKTASKKIVNRTCDFIGNKVADASTKSKNDEIVKPDENPWNVEEIISPIEKIDEILKELGKLL